jgi:hypothetical protein
MLGLKKVEPGRWKNDWMEFYPGFHKWNFRYLPSNGLNWKLDFCFIWGQFYMTFKTNKPPKYKDERPTYGFYFYSVSNWFPDSLWFHRGTKKIKCIDLPWQYDWVRTSVFLKDGTWTHDTKKNKTDFYDPKFKNKIHTEKHTYYYIHDGIFQETEAICTLEEREWRPKCFKWTGLFKKVRTTIDVEFTNPIGSGVNTYKGGTYGAGHDIKKGETIRDCLIRMMDERKF